MLSVSGVHSVFGPASLSPKYNCFPQLSHAMSYTNPVILSTGALSLALQCFLLTPCDLKSG